MKQKLKKHATRSSDFTANRSTRRNKAKKTTAWPRLHAAAYPFLLLAVLCIGVLVVGWTYNVVADSYTVTGKVPAPPLTSGAIITNPLDGTVEKTSPIIVNGTCPQGSYVKLTRSGVFSGVAWCNLNGSFQITTSLFTGSNAILAQDYNITDDPGPATPGVILTYEPPVNVVAPSIALSAGTLPLLIQADFHFQSFAINKLASINFSIQGGTHPYIIRVQWGDQSTSVETVNGSDVTMTHTYMQTGYYAVIVQVSDAVGAETDMQLATLVKPSLDNGANASLQRGAKPSGWDAFWAKTRPWLWLAWPVYATIALMTVSFWLGEREAFVGHGRKIPPTVISPRSHS